ncbi:hypothetical protein PENSPDRAFT_749827 [Peniophora sp. CONT]|nr:hypothetical protein PENSPDRAFT_749827 [Peniophora sp. CONT]
MPLSGITSGLLSAWLVGPIYGVNVAMVVFIILKLWPRRESRLFRIILLVTILLISSCTAHAFMYLDDLIRGFGSDGSAHIGGVNGYFIDNSRFNVLVCLSLYVFNCFCNNLFIAWRVYVTWARNLRLSAVLVLWNIGVLVTAAVAFSRLADHITLRDPATMAVAIVSWALSITIQISGALLIAWNTLQTPKVVGDDTNARTPRRIPGTLFCACVESGCPSLVTEMIVLGFVRSDLSVILAMVAVLGQITAFSSFAIVLRELQKAEIDYAKGFVNATSALAMHDLPRIRGRRSMHSLEGLSGPGNTVMVAIETSRHGDGSVMKPQKSFH